MTSLNWQRIIEQIVISDKRSRVVGLMSARRGAGVSLISRCMAKTMVAGRAKTLLIDMSNSRQEGFSARLERTPSLTALRNCIVSSLQGYDILPGVDGEERAAFANLPWLRETLQHDFKGYDRIVVDLPAFYEQTGDDVNAVAAAATCDRLLLVCRIGIDNRSEIAELSKLLRSSGVPLAGTIANEFSCAGSGRRMSLSNLFNVS